MRLTERRANLPSTAAGGMGNRTLEKWLEVNVLSPRKVAERQWAWWSSGVYIGEVERTVEISGGKAQRRPSRKHRGLNQRDDSGTFRTEDPVPAGGPGPSLGGPPARLWMRLSELSERFVPLLLRARAVRKGETGGLKKLVELGAFISGKIKQRNNLKEPLEGSHREKSSCRSGRKAGNVW